MLKFRSLPLRAGSLQDVLGGATKSSQVMLSGLTQFWGSIGAKGLDDDLAFTTCAGNADTVSSIAAARTTIEADERPLGAMFALQSYETAMARIPIRPKLKSDQVDRAKTWDHDGDSG
jgi:hypothetical protein